MLITNPTTLRVEGCRIRPPEDFQGGLCGLSISLTLLANPRPTHVRSSAVSGTTFQEKRKPTGKSSLVKKKSDTANSTPTIVTPPVTARTAPLPQPLAVHLVPPSLQTRSPSSPLVVASGLLSTDTKRSASS